MKNNPIAITVPNTCRKDSAENLNERKPTISVNMAINKAIDVKIVPLFIAVFLASIEKSRIVSLEILSFESATFNSSLILNTTCKP